MLPWGNSEGCFLRPHSHARWLEIGMNSWQKRQLQHHRRSPQVGQIHTFMDTVLL
jgi:hypothetical protein